MDLSKLVFYKDIGDKVSPCFCDVYYELNDIIEIAEQHGFSGNLWQFYIAYLLANSENSYSLSCEMRGDVGGSISKIADGDFSILKAVFFEDLYQDLPELKAYVPATVTPNDNINQLVKLLSSCNNEVEFKGVVTDFYKNFGIGNFALNRAFHLVDNVITPVLSPDPIRLCDLVGYDTPKERLRHNTEAFIQGKPANNCLLFGSAGTGKSSCVKAVLNEYHLQGLRLIELYKHQLKELGRVISEIKKRNHKFIIFMDDLSFEQFEVEYKYLKAVIEGSIERRPNNVLIYATSNRRHLIKEDYSDREGLHGNETVQEKISLSARFGEMIFFDSPDKKQYNNIVKTLAEREGLCIGDEELSLIANKWELSHSGKSGRTARQLVDHLLGQKAILP